jgi:uncharacterized protein
MEIPPSLNKIVSQQPYPIFFATISGSHLYGFPSPDSDYDLRGVHILPIKELLGLNIGSETIEYSNLHESLQIDLVTYDVKTFFLLLLKKNGSVLEQLYSPLILKTTPEHEELKHIAKNCITRNHQYHYLGFAETQWKMFAKEEPRQVKPLLYVYRVLLTGTYLMQTGIVEANLGKLNEIFNLPYISYLIEAKLVGAEKSVLQDVDFNFYQAEYERLRTQLDEAYQVSSLPAIPLGKDDLHDLLLRLRGAK